MPRISRRRGGGGQDVIVLKRRTQKHPTIESDGNRVGGLGASRKGNRDNICAAAPSCGTEASMSLVLKHTAHAFSFASPFSGKLLGDAGALARGASLLLFGAAVACGPSQKKACEGCEGEMLEDCEETFELCKDVKGCKRRHVKKDYADGICQDEE